jgi:hypothetical protein
MKILLRKVLFVISLLFLLLVNTAVFADEPGPPNPGGNPAGNGPAGPTGGPINDGIYILLVLGIAYVGFKTYEIRKKKVSPKKEGLGV